MNKLPDEYLDRILDGESLLLCWREYRGLSEQDLADLANISVERLAAYEAEIAAPSAEETARLAAALNVTAGDIASLDDDSTASPRLYR